MTKEELKQEAEEYYNGQYDAWLEGEDSFALEEEIEQAFKDGAEFGYNKANEWHFLRNRDFPVRDDYYVIACHSVTGDFTDRCQWLNNEWWNADGEVKHFINEKVYAWKEKSQPPKEIES